ncbi:hypothetical protein BsWGS_12287 [Bradybaena similaris]
MSNWSGSDVRQRAHRSRSMDELSCRGQHPAFTEPAKKKSSNIFHTLFRRRRSSKHSVFGLPLSKVCDENLDPPESIIKLMVLIYKTGPQTPGILRRGSKATLCKEIRDKIDSGETFFLEDHMSPTAASVFKEFLRSIPEGLLVNNLYQHWTTIKRDIPRAEMITRIKIILSKLPPVHYRLTALTICLLQHLAKYSSQNHMGPSNLAMCIAPSFYACEAASSPQCRHRKDSLKQTEMENSVNDIQNVFVPLITFMIINHIEIFGEAILTMFTKYGCSASPAINLTTEGCLPSEHIYEKHCARPPVSSASILPQPVDSACRSSQKHCARPPVSSASILPQSVDSACRSSQKLTLPQETSTPRGRAALKLKSRIEILYSL